MATGGSSVSALIPPASVLELGDERWTSFVRTHPGALPFHHPAWASAVSAAYGFRALALASLSPGGAVTGGVPVIEVRHLRRRWVSLPFTDLCPLLVRPDVDPMTLVEGMDKARVKAGVRRFEVRGELPGPVAAPGRSAYEHEIDLRLPEADLFASFHRNQVQRHVRRAQRAGVEVCPGVHERDLTDTFFRLHAMTRHRLGVPVQPRRYFREVWRRVVEPGLGRLLIARVDGRAVAAVVLLLHGDTAVYKYGASDHRHWRSGANQFLFWEGIRWARARGCSRYHLGRTGVRDEGLRAYKLHWGASERLRSYSTLADRATRQGDGEVSEFLRAVLRRTPPWAGTAIGTAFYRFTA